MRRRRPQSLWDTLRDWWDGDDEESAQSHDSTSLLHLLFTMPFAIVLLSAIRGLSGL